MNTFSIILSWSKLQTHCYIFLPAVAPVIYSSPNDTIVTRTESLHLVCIFRGFPSPSIEWYFNGSLLSQDERINITEEYSDLTSTSTISIMNTTFADSGEYSCVGINDAGNISSIPPALILIQGKGVNPCNEHEHV